MFASCVPPACADATCCCCLSPFVSFGSPCASSRCVCVWCVCAQERQDALYEITDDPSINMMVVVGGFNSSNTSHLQEIAEHKGIPSFWVDSAARIDVEGNKVRVRVPACVVSCVMCCLACFRAEAAVAGLYCSIAARQAGTSSYLLTCL